MIKLVRKIFTVLTVISLLFPFDLNKIEAASDTLTKTVEFFVGQDSSVRADGNQFFFTFANVIIPETSPVIKSAIVEIGGVSYNSSGVQTINVDLKQNSEIAGPGTTYTLAQNDKPKSFSIRYDASGTVIPAVSSYTLYLKGSTAAGAKSFSVFSAKLILTYQYSASSAGLLKTTKFFIEQKINQAASGAEINRTFTISIPEESSPENIPLVRSVFVEIGGSVKGSVAGTIEAKMTKMGFDPGYSLYNLDLNSSSCGASCITPFLVRYDASSVVDGSDFPGGKDYTFYFRGTNFDTNLLSAKVIITYKYTESAGGLPVKGELISSTIDTGVIKGAAYNSVMWKGSLSGGAVGQVGLQLATSDSDAGPWVFKGPDCLAGANYAAEPDTPIEITCAEHNNKRYFRYKVIICSNSDCSTSGAINPEVNGVIVNWAP